MSERTDDRELQAATAADAPPEATLAEEQPGRHGRVGYGRFGRWTPLLLGLLLLLILALAYALGGGENPAQRERETGNVAGEPAPDVSLTLLDGSSLRLADLRGKVVVLNFWASWCGPCRTEAPVLQAYSEQAKANGENTVVVGVGIRTDTDADARAFVRDKGLTYPIGRDTDTDQPGVGPVEAAFGVPGAYPSTLFITPDGTVDRYHLGPITEQQLRYAVEQARQAG
ncbi:MAG: TlpA family protein disulfide reductase [Thermomicrobiales bacterium]|nr:TlpA family protein disulfide reductase [Thermomicrobiales bacterium]